MYCTDIIGCYIFVKGISLSDTVLSRALHTELVSSTDITGMSALDIASISESDIVSVSAPDIVSVSSSDVVSVSSPDMASVSAPDVVSVSEPDVVSLSAPNVVPMSAPDIVSVSTPDIVSVSEPDVVSLSAPNVVPMSAPDIVSVSAPNIASVSAPDVASVSAISSRQEASSVLNVNNGSRSELLQSHEEVRTAIDFPLPGLAGPLASGSSHLPVSGSSDLSVPGSSDLPVPAPSQLPVTAPSHLPVLGSSDLSVPGSSDPPVPRPSDVPVTGLSDLSTPGPSNLVRPAISSELPGIRLNDSKAGMEGLDVDKINQIIEEASRGSKFYQHKQRAQQRIDRRVQEMKVQERSFTEHQLSRATTETDAILSELESARNLHRWCVHLDMDAFFASVEMRDNPELRDVPMAVGSWSMLSTSNYAARRFGVRAAMPGFIARKLCPHLVIVESNFDKYRSASNIVRSILARYDENVSMASLDEGYLDLTSLVESQLLSSESSNAEVNDLTAREQQRCSLVEQIVAKMRAEIHQATGLTASAGIACNSMLAKICSDRNKPDGQFLLQRRRADISAFLQPLPVRRVSGIGPVTSQLLAALGVTVCGHVLEHRSRLRLLLSEGSCRFLLRVAVGVAASEEDEDGEEVAGRKSISSETTLPRATSCVQQLQHLSQRLCHQLAAELHERRLLAGCVTLKLKTADFRVLTRSEQLQQPTRAEKQLGNCAARLLQRELQVVSQPIRLLGVRVSALTERCGSRQVTLDSLLGASQVRYHRRVSVMSRGKSLYSVQSDNQTTASRSVSHGPGKEDVRNYDGKLYSDGSSCVKQSSHGESIADLCSNPHLKEKSHENIPDTAGEEVVSAPSIEDDKAEQQTKEVREMFNSSAVGRKMTELSSNGTVLDHHEEENERGRSRLAVLRSTETVICPVCQCVLTADIQSVNSHLDECLSRQLIQDLEDQQQGQPQREDTTGSILTDTCTSPATPALKRSNSTEIRPTDSLKCRKIHEFFSRRR